MKIFSLGEVLVDMLGKQQPDENGLLQKVFQPFAGGAPANVAVAVAKLGGQASLVSKVGEDNFGKFLCKTLKSYKVDTQYVGVSKGKTALAFVDLDEHGERTFDFYVENAAQKDIQIADTQAVALDNQSVVHMCSGSFSTDTLAGSANALIDKARDSGALLCMDINYRPGFWANLDGVEQHIAQAASKMDIIKASREELLELYGANDSHAVIAQWLKDGVSLVLVTDGGNPVAYHTAKFDGTFAVPKTQVSDTTAAGDSFIGGVLYQLTSSIDSSAAFSDWASDFENITRALDFATRCGAITVSRFGAFDALPTAHDMN
ncbi:carbohydrate kinase family protein [Salinimonas lutimaris]|uniref:carbohydrate kinase family protein n=1 Tax=Salinimonas lutimaris TaxID=914153 RepID=UPI0010BF8CE8|nr:carbohydrate kinase [Salinimonas lutimaris]